jgi:hypothetical protein
LTTGNPFTTGDLPRGRLRDRLELLPSTARNRAIDWLHRFEFPEADAGSLDVDEEGGVFYVDENLPSGTLFPTASGFGWMGITN